MKLTAKNIIYSALNLIEPLIRIFCRQSRVSILMYHSIGDNGLIFTITRENFHRQLEYLKQNGYKIIALSDLIEALENNIQLQDKTVVLTFDDAYSDNYEIAWPILREFGYAATIFVPTALLGGELNNSQSRALKIMSPQQISELAASGQIEFGSHTSSHGHLEKMTDEQFIEEVRESKTVIEGLTGRPCNIFSYPRGFYCESFMSILKEQGFSAAVTVDEGLIGLGSLFKLKRNFVYSSESFIEFKGKLGCAVEIFSTLKLLFKR